MKKGNIISIIVWLIIYQLISLAINKNLLVPSLYSIVMAFFSLCSKKVFWVTVLFSVLRILFGFLSAVIFGVIIAGISYFFKHINTFLYPALSVIKATPVASFIILAILWIKTGYVPAFISFLTVLPIIWSNVFQGLNQTDKKLIEMADVFEFGFLKKIKMIYIPQITPYFKTACITGLGFAWKSGVAAEVISVPNLSVGRRLYEAKIYIETSELFAWTFVVIILSILFEKILIFLFKLKNR